MSKIVVIGSNHAGTAAINTILDNYKGHEVVAFDMNNNISFLGCGMALWIGNQIEGASGLFYSSKEKLEEKGAKLYIETRVERVDYEKKTVYAKSKDGKEITEQYDKLILATGSLPIPVDVPGKDLKNVQFVKLYQNAEDVINKLNNEDIKRVAVVGAGYIGVELAEAFVRRGKHVDLVDLNDGCLTGYYDKEFRDIMTQNLIDNGIDVHFGERLLEIKGDKQVESLVTDKNTYPTDMVILAIGFRPNNALGKEHLELFRNGAYVVDLNQKTSDDNVYAIGDCATVYDNSLRKTNYIALATNAVRSGIIAAHNAAGTALQGIGVQGSNGISIFKLNMLSTGLTFERAKALGINALETTFEDLQKPAFVKEGNYSVKLRIVYEAESRRIIGAQMAARGDVSMGMHLFSLAIQEGLTIDKFKLLDILFLPHFNQPYNYITMAALSAK